MNGTAQTRVTTVQLVVSDTLGGSSMLPLYAERVENVSGLAL